MSPKTHKLPGSSGDRLSATYRYLFRKKNSPDRGGAKLNREVRDTIVSSELRQGMVATLQSASGLGLCIGKISEASIQFQPEKYLVTKKGCWFHSLLDKDLILASGAPSSVEDDSQTPVNWKWHLGIYQQDSTTQAVLIGQPAALMALVSEKKLPEEDLLPAASDAVGRISLCTPDLAAISTAVEHANVLIIPGIGGISCGETLSEAVINLEIVNRWCEITLLANS